MTEDILLFIQFLVSFSGSVFLVMNIVDLFRFKHIERLEGIIRQLERRIKQLEDKINRL